MAERLADGNVAIALFANSVATGAALVALILALGPISGAHFNPAVTMVEAWQGGLAWREVPGFVAAQIAGAFAGVASAHIMFAERLFSVSDRARAGGAQVFGEFVATFGLLAVIRGCARHRPDRVAFAVGVVYHGGLLVHVLDVLRKSSGHAGTHPHRYVCRHPAHRRTGVHGGSVCRRVRWCMAAGVADSLGVAI